jgi:hypothetical protein
MQNHLAMNNSSQRRWLPLRIMMMDWGNQ